MSIRKITVIHNNELLRRRLVGLLTDLGCEVTVAADGHDLLSTIESCDVAIVDCKTVDIWDAGFMARLRACAPNLPLVLTIQPGRLESYVALVSTDAWEHLPEPFYRDTVAVLLHRLGEQQKLVEQNRYLWAELETTRGQADVNTRDPRMTQILRQVSKVAATDAAVLILGERGTEKEKVARLVHKASERRNLPFIEAGCRQGEEESFTRLFSDAGGGFASLIMGGTIFLREVTALAPEAQARLLRAMEDDSCARVVSSSSDDPFEEVERGAFREDLFFRINAAQVFVPPLRERTADIALLAQEFMEQFGMPKPEDGWDELAQYDWPGNVNELEAAVRLAAIRRNRCDSAAEHLLPPRFRPENRRPFRRKGGST